MRLCEEERAMLAGELGEPRRWALAHQVAVGAFFDAADFVPVSQAHIMADTESLGEAGVAFLETLAAAPAAERRVRVPTITDPRGVDPRVYRRLGQSDAMAAIEARAAAAFAALGILMTDTCINYQTILPPLRGEHVAYGDTGVVIYSNSVFGARSNFEGGPSALAAALTGRTPRYGYHLDENRRATRHFRLECTPRDLAEWGAAGAIVGRAVGSYWAVPLIDGIEEPAASDEPALRIGRAELDAFLAAYAAPGDKVDVVVFAAPQLSLVEMAAVADAIDGRRVHPDTTLFVSSSPEVKSAADRLGLTARMEAAGAVVASGICFYQSYAGEMAEANGWKRLVTNSAKLVNIIAGYGYRPTLASLERCVEAAVAGRLS